MAPLRAPLVLVPLAVLVALLAPAAAYHDRADTPGGDMCPAYTREADVKLDEDPYLLRTRAQTSDGRALLLTMQYQEGDSSYTVYVAVDWLLVNGPDTGFSIWLYEESNGIPGLQRADKVCDDTPEGERPDARY